MLDGFQLTSRVASRVGAVTRRARRSSDGLPPGPDEPPAWQLLAWIQWPISLLLEMRKRYGATFTMRFPAVDPFVIFSEPEAVKEIFTGPSDALYAGQANAVLEPIVGAHSVLLLDGEKHMRQRKLLLPPFHGERMHAYGAAMRDATLASMRGFPEGRAFPMQRETQAITLDVILRTVFGMDEGAHLDHMRDRISRFLDLGQNPYLLMAWAQVDLGPWSPGGKLVRLGRDVDETIYDQIDRRRAQGHEGRTDVLSMLMQARDEAGATMTDVELRDELVTLLVAGHETTATTLAWIFLHLTKERAVLERAIAEVDAAFGGGEVDADRAAQLPYIEAIVREGLRLRPVIPMVGRRLQRPMRIGGIDLPAGVIATPSIWLSHMNEDTWAEPERFRPDRFLEKKWTPYEHFPFGGGIRRCIGMAFALYEMKIVLATILSRFDVRAAPGYDGRLVRRGISFAPSEGMPIVVTKRR